MNDERAVLDALLPDAQEGEEPDPAVDRSFTAAVDEADGDGGGRDGDADHSPVLARRLTDQGVDRLVQDLDATRPRDLQYPDHPWKEKSLIKLENKSRFFTQDFALAAVGQ